VTCEPRPWPYCPDSMASTPTAPEKRIRKPNTSATRLRSGICSPETTTTRRMPTASGMPMMSQKYSKSTGAAMTPRSWARFSCREAASSSDMASSMSPTRTQAGAPRVPVARATHAPPRCRMPPPASSTVFHQEGTLASVSTLNQPPISPSWA